MGPSADYSLLSSILLHMAIGLAGALMGGSVLVFFLNVKYNDKSYWYTLAIVAVPFLCPILVVNEVLSFFLQ